MEKVSQAKKSLWMRYVDFGRIRDALQLLIEHDGELRAKDLEMLCIKRGIFLREDEKPFSRTTMYHYRKVMEHLHMVRVDHKRYFVEGTNQLAKLLEQESRLGSLSLEEKEALANTIIQNPDCQSFFFNIFSLDGGKFTNAEQFRTKASYIIAETDERGIIVLRNPRTEVCCFLNTKDKLHAIFWGVRLWALNLEIIDEIFIYGEGRVMFPILYKGSKKAWEIIDTMLRELKSTQTWETLSIPELTRSWAPYLRISTQELHDAFRALHAKFPQFVDFIPTSTSFIDIMTPFPRRDNALFKGYIKDSQGRFISHIRLHHNIWKEYRDRRSSNVPLK